MVESISLYIDESSVTGESRHIVKKKHKNPFLLSGSNVVEGSGSYLSCAVGKRSFAGKTRNLLNEADSLRESTPLALKLDNAATQLGYFSLIFAGIIVTCICIKVLLLN